MTTSCGHPELVVGRCATDRCPNRASKHVSGATGQVVPAPANGGFESEVIQAAREYAHECPGPSLLDFADWLGHRYG